MEGLHLPCQQPRAEEDREAAPNYSHTGHFFSPCRRTVALTSCQQQPESVLANSQVHHDTYGYQFLCGTSAPVSATHTAGHVSEILNCMLTAVTEHLTVDKTRTLELVLCSLALVCPAAACAFAPHTSARAKDISTAAASAAVEMMQCACTLLRLVDMSSEEAQDVLSHVKGYARIDLSVALAHVLLAAQQVPQRLRGAAADLVHCFLGLSEFAWPFLHSWQDKSELPCPAALADGSAAGSIPVGQALFVGLLPRAGGNCKGGLLLTDGGRLGAECRGSTSSTRRLPDNRSVLESLLSQSSAATGFAVAKGLHVTWADNLALSLQGLGGSEQAQVCPSVAVQLLDALVAYPRSLTTQLYPGNR